jgi:glucose/arabinose dehydrogenase
MKLRLTVRVLAVVGALALAAGCTGTPDRRAVEPGGRAGQSGRPGDARFSNPQVVADHLEVPWGLAFLPDGSALVSERDRGRILRLRPGARPAEVARVPGVEPAGEGGLLGIAVSRDYQRDRLVYAYFSSDHDNRIVRFRLGEQPQPILTGIPRGTIHNGGRLAFGPDGMLYATTGETGRRSNAQDPRSLGGKILRLTPDGGAPGDNPTRGSPVYSIGHRNVQGIAWDAAGRLFASELGQNRFDEINRIEAGRNYGWPKVEGGGGASQGFVDPLLTWRTSESSPSGVAIDGDTLYVAALRGQRLWAVPLDPGGGVGRPAALLSGRYGRLRTVAVAPDRAIWVLTSNRDGRGDPAADDDRVLRFPRQDG